MPQPNINPCYNGSCDIRHECYRFLSHASQFNLHYQKYPGGKKCEGHMELQTMDLQLKTLMQPKMADIDRAKVAQRIAAKQQGGT